MGFLEWLFDGRKLVDDKKIRDSVQESYDKAISKVHCAPVLYERVDADNNSIVGSFNGVGLSRVPKWFKAGRKGKTILCPACGEPDHFFDFGWQTQQCGGCGECVDKYDWFLPQENADDC